MYSHAPNANNTELIIYSLFPLIFCILALFVLLYYIRRRYKLYKGINGSPSELLKMQSYKNHLKNLKIKCIINNFIIVIIAIELVQNLGQFMAYLPSWNLVFNIENANINTFMYTIQYYTYLIAMPIRFSVVPVLCLLMNFLWLVYRQYEYKYTIIRWTWYIVIRTSLIYLSNYIYLNGFLHNSMYLLHPFSNIFWVIFIIIIAIVNITDFILYVYYSKKFYSHLKSKEKEIKLFYFDKKAYLDIKYLRIHFKIATILVVISILLFVLGASIDPVTILALISSLDCFPNYWKDLMHSITISVDNYIFVPSLLLSKTVIILNYLYIFIIVVYKSYISKRKLANINNYIKPIVNKYHQSYYNHYINA